MYLSDRDLRWAIDQRNLIVEPKPERIDPTSIDLHLDSIDQAKVWDLDAFNRDQHVRGSEPYELRIGKFKYTEFAPEYLKLPTDDPDKPVFRRGKQIIVKPGGFLLWQTKEWVGTPEEGASLMAFIDGKSTRARTGILVHLTAPTIHAGWAGNITLEIANLGPFHFVLEEGDAIAQIVVATISSIPAQTMKAGSVTYRQDQVSGIAKAAVKAKRSPTKPTKAKR
jgi:dCTP deaminase